MDTMRSGLIYGRTKLAAKEDELCACRPKVEAVQVENLTSSIFKLDSPKCKDGVKRGWGVLDNQKHQKNAKKQKTIDLEHKCVEDKLEEILSCQEIAQKRQQLKKLMVKDVKNLLSLQEATVKNVKVGPEKHCEVQTSKKISRVLGNVPKMVSHHETHGPKEINCVLGKVTGIGKWRMAQAPEKILSVLGKVPQLKTEQKEPLPTDMVNVLSLSNIFKGDKYPTKKHDREEKQATVGDLPQDEFIEVKKAHKLSSIFK